MPRSCRSSGAPARTRAARNWRSSTAISRWISTSGIRSRSRALTTVAVRGIRRLMLRTGRGPLRPVWRVLHEGLLRALALFLRGPRSRNAAYAGGSLAGEDAVYGLSDFDVAIVVADDAAGDEVRRRRDALRRLPGLDAGLDVSVFRQADLRRPAATIMTFGLAHDDPSAAYRGSADFDEAAAVLERPRLYGPFRGR